MYQNLIVYDPKERESKIERGEREREGWREKTRRRERGDNKGG